MPMWHSDEWMNAGGLQERIAELRRENDRKCTLSREAALQFLTEIANTPIAAVTKDSRLAQAMKDTDDVHEIRMPDKLGAIVQLSRMCDWTVDRVHVTAGDSLSAYIIALRQRPIGGGEVIELENGSLAELENEENGARE
jgi:MoxR-like ATPase